MNERNVCIGDIIAVGDEAQIQVSLPRMPCFKLNHRFSLKNFAPETYQSSRTGWYYRVLREGTVKAGDKMRLVERKHPEWTIERIQQYLHREKDNLEMNAKLADIEALGQESRGQFTRRVAKAKENKPDPKNEEVWRDFKVTSRKMTTPRILHLSLETENIDNDIPKELPAAHARIKLPNGLIRKYSMLCGDDSGIGAGNKFQLGIALDENSKGGSKYLHENVQEGDIIQVGRVTTDMDPRGSASNHVFIAGGIGITAFLDIMKAMHGINWSVQLHLAVRSSEDVAFKDLLEPFGDRVVIYDKSKGERMDIPNVIKNMPWNSHVYVCGPTRMMEAAKAAVEANGIPPDEVSYEAFSADTSGDPFEAEIANKDGKVIKVGEDETLLDALRRDFEDFPSSCEVGNCGTCKVTVTCGKVDHRGNALSPEEQGNSMLACVSRGVGRIGIEI